MEEILLTNPPDLLTKTDAEALIDRLASKELTFGCRVHAKNNTFEGYTVLYSFKDGEHFVAYDEEYEEIPRDRDLLPEVFKSSNFQILGHPIYLHDVLVKIFAGNGSQKHNVVATVIEFWRVCGIDKSLQSILAKIEWKEEDPCNHPDKEHDSTCFMELESRIVQVAKPSPETDLILFIKNLGL